MAEDDLFGFKKDDEVEAEDFDNIIEHQDEIMNGNEALKILKGQKGKESVSVTLDKPLVQELKKIKRQEGLKTLSPIVNLILWNWVHHKYRKEKGNERKSTYSK